MIIVLGSTGYIGRAFVDELQARGLSHIGVSRADIDYTKSANLKELLPGADFVINAAGYTGKPNVDACELHRDETYRGNVDLPYTIGSACRDLGIPFGHVSSGCIYTGSKENGSGFTEEDEPNFCFGTPTKCSWYSGTKATGEVVLKCFERKYIWRLRIPFDEYDNERNYLSKLQRYEKLYEATNSVSHKQDFVQACIDLIDMRAPYGIYNITNPGAITTSYVTEQIKEILGIKKDFKFWKDDKEFYSMAAKTPRSNCILDTSKLKSVGINMRTAQEAIRDSLMNWKPETIYEQTKP